MAINKKIVMYVGEGQTPVKVGFYDSPVPTEFRVGAMNNRYLNRHTRNNDFIWSLFTGESGDTITMMFGFAGGTKFGTNSTIDIEVENPDSCLSNQTATLTWSDEDKEYVGTSAGLANLIRNNIKNYLHIKLSY